MGRAHVHGCASSNYLETIGVYLSLMPMRVGKELEAAVLRCEFNQIMDAKLKIKQALAEIGVFIFNKEKKEVLGRTCQSWGKQFSLCS